jgi:hypothetical protein
MTKTDIDTIRHLIQSPEWSKIKMVAFMTVQETRSKMIPKDSQWEMTKFTLGREGEVKGIMDFFKKLEQIANQDDN